MIDPAILQQNVSLGVDFSNEVRRLLRLRHPNLIRVLSLCVDVHPPHVPNPVVRATVTASAPLKAIKLHMRGGVSAKIASIHSAMAAKSASSVASLPRKTAASAAATVVVAETVVC